jgi:hypothetical protein
LPDVELFAREESHTLHRRFATVALLLVAAIAAVSAGIYSFLHNESPPPSPRIETVATAPSPPPAVVKPIAKAAVSISTALPPPADTAPISAAELTPPTEVVGLPLNARGISELQTKLGKIGFSPGQIDGVAGPKTVAAIKRYQEARSRAQTGAADTAVLDQLRKEPTP